MYNSLSLVFSYKHKYLLMFGASNLKVLVENHSSEGATREELSQKAIETFNLKTGSFVIQNWDTDFAEFVDISKCERVLSPTKVRVVTVVEQFPVHFSSNLLESVGT